MDRTAHASLGHSRCVEELEDEERLFTRTITRVATLTARSQIIVGSSKLELVAADVYPVAVTVRR